MTEPITSEELLVGGSRCRFNLASDSSGWIVVGPVHTNNGLAPFFEMEGDAWATREDAMAAVEAQAGRLLAMNRPPR